MDEIFTNYVGSKLEGWQIGKLNFLKFPDFFCFYTEYLVFRLLLAVERFLFNCDITISRHSHVGCTWLYFKIQDIPLPTDKWFGHDTNTLVLVSWQMITITLTNPILAWMILINRSATNKQIIPQENPSHHHILN